MTTPRARHARPIHLAPFGLHSRYMLASYLRHFLMVATALVTIALTIDLWPQIPLFTADPALAGWRVLWVIARLGVLRIPDLLPPFIPFTTFLAVVWSEISFTESRERILIWNSGRSPLFCLAPALMIGLFAGVTLFVLDGYVRPAAIAVQIAEKLGREGRRLDRTQSGGHQWIALPDGLLRAEIEYGPPLKLHEPTIYKLDGDGHLSEVDTAVTAVPLPGVDRWLLSNGHYWRADPNIGADRAGTIINTMQENETPFTRRVISMKLNVLWLGNLGMSPQYLPMPVLLTLVHAEINAHDLGSFRTRLQTLRGESLLPCAMALLAASLSMFFFAYRTPPVSLFMVLLVGYLAHFTDRAFALMGEFGYVPPVIAGWLVPVALFAATGGVLLLIQRRRGLRAGPRPGSGDA